MWHGLQWNGSRQAVLCDLLLLKRGADLYSRVLLSKARKIAMQYYRIYLEQIPVRKLTQEIAEVMQEYTQKGYVLFKLGYSSYDRCLEA